MNSAAACVEQMGDIVVMDDIELLGVGFKVKWWCFIVMSRILQMRSNRTLYESQTLSKCQKLSHWLVVVG